MSEETTDETPARDRKLHWDKRKFLQHWVANAKLTTWAEFYGAMKKACAEDTGGGVLEEVSLSARLGSFSRHLKAQGYLPPARPERPQSTPETLGDIAAELGLKALPNSEASAKATDALRDSAARARAEMKTV